MDWARIMVPMSGGEADRRVVAAANAIAEPFGAELAFVYTPADVADLIPWMGDGFMGGVQATAVESIRVAAQEGEAAAKGVPYAARDVFIDDDLSSAAIDRQLARTENVAQHNGSAVAIGHGHDPTIAALRVWLPTLHEKRLALVPLSAVVRHRMARP